MPLGSAGRARYSSLQAQHGRNVVERLYRALESGDMATAEECFDAEAVWRVPGCNQTAGEYRGWGQILGFFQKLRTLTDGTFHVEPIDILGDAGRCVGIQRLTGQREGKPLDVTACLLFEVARDKVSSVQIYYSEQYALDGFWDDRRDGEATAIPTLSS